MELLNIKINIDTLSLNNQMITGDIFFSLDDFKFPDKNWNDFVVVILSWWHNAFTNIYNKENEVVEFYFMDGPYFIRASCISKDIMDMQFINDSTDSEIILFTCQTNINEFKNSLLNSTKALINELHLRNWATEETEELEKLWGALNQLP